MEKGFLCSSCGKYHDELPLDWGFDAPYYWNDELALKDPEKNSLGSDDCVINLEYFFIRGIIEIPIVDAEKTFNWGVWVSLKKENFERYIKVYGTKKELEEEPYFGWLSNQLPGYPESLKIKTMVHLQGGGFRPKILLDHSDPHPLCQEQHSGISMHRVNEIVETASIANK